MRAANSSPRSPANTRCVCESTKPGITQRPAASIRSSGERARLLDRDDRAVLDDQRRVADEPERALARALGSLVTSRPMSSTTRRSLGPPRSAAGDVERRVARRRARSTRRRPSRRGRRRRSPRTPRSPPRDRARCPPAARSRARASARSASAPGAQPAALRPAERGVAAGGRGVQQVAGAVGAADAGGEPLVELDRARLLERVDDRVGVGAEWRAPRRRRRAGGPARCRRRGRARSSGRGNVAPAPPSSATSSSVRCVAWTAVKRGPSAPASASSAVGVHAVARRGSPRSPPAARETCACSGRPPSAHSATTRAASGSTARTLWIAAPTRAGPRSASASTRSAHASAASRSRKRSDAAVQVARVEQRDPHARPARAAASTARPIAFGSS